MTVKREKMDEIVPKIQLGIIVAYVTIYLFGSVRHLKKTVKTFTSKKR